MTTAVLELREVSKVYGTGPAEVDALRRVNLSVRGGELVAVMGPSGSGKSSLLTIAGSLEQPTSGQVLVMGTDLSHLSPNDQARLRRRLIGYVFQDFNLLAGFTAIENVTVPLELDGTSAKAAHAAGMKALAELGIAERAHHFPDELSGGERQRVAIARAVVGDRRLLLADEPTGALDSVNAKAVMQLMLAICRRGVAGVVVTHDAQLASCADRVVLLQDGQVIDQTQTSPGPDSLLTPGHAAMSVMLHDRPVLPGSPSGGTAARRVVTRWARRLLRREWRQQILVLALLALTVAAATFGVAAAYNVASLPGPQFGSAGYLLQFAGTSQKTTTADIAAARKAFGTIEVIGRQFVPVPGSTQDVEYRALSPDGPYTGPMLALVQGHYPAGAGQVAVTSGVAQDLRVRIGSVLSLPGHHQRVTGIVENPSDLNDQFALVPPSAAGPAQGVTVLLDASPATFAAFRDTFHGQLVWQARGASTQAAVAAGALGAVTVLMVLVSLVAAAAFAVIAARRQRQLGMLAAIGATRKQLRMVMVAGGALVGGIAAVTGAVVGLAAWFAAAPHLEASAGHRIDRFAVPWHLVVLGMLLAILTAAGAAWWPARAASRVPVVSALSARPLKPRPAHRTAFMGALLIVLALACLTLANQASGPLIVFGALAMALGISFISPLSIRALTAVGRRVPVAVRLALRDLARYQARSAAALAAISLALGIAVAIMISSAAATNAASTGNLPDNQMQIWIGQPGDNQLVPVRTPAELSALAAAVHQIAGSLGGAAVIPLDMPVNPASKPQPGGQQPVVSLNAPVDQTAGRNGDYRSLALYVATPAVLRHLGINPATIDPATNILTIQSGQDDLTTITTLTEATNIQRIHVPDYGSEPTSLITLNGLRHWHWTQVQSGWMVTFARPLLAAQIAAAREVAAKSGLVIESRNTQASLATISTAATAAGALIALGVLAMAVGLIRAEAAGDVRTLTAIGATSTTRRTLTATTGGTLALLGSLLGSGAAYLALAAGHRSDISVLSRVPVPGLTITIVGVPAAAALAGWILAGRRPPSVARHPLD